MARRNQTAPLVRAKLYLGGAGENASTAIRVVARREPERLILLTLCFLGATVKYLGQADICARFGQIWIKYQ